MSRRSARRPDRGSRGSNGSTRPRTPGVAHGSSEQRGSRSLLPEELRWCCDPSELEPALAKEERQERLAAKELAKEGAPGPESERKLRLAPRVSVEAHELVGQERALEAIRDGLSLDGPGWNVFVVGPPGSGRETLVRAALSEASLGEGRKRGERAVPPWGTTFPEPRDRLYVADFDRPDRPRLVTLPRGQGKRFKREVDELISTLRNALGIAFEEESFRSRREGIRRRAERRARRAFMDFLEPLLERLRYEDLSIGEVRDGFPSPELRLELEVKERKKRVTRRWLTAKQIRSRIESGSIRRSRTLEKKLARMEALARSLDEAAARSRAIARKGERALKRLDDWAARAVAEGPVRDLAARFPTPAVRRYCEQLLEHLGERLHVFLESHPEEPPPEEPRDRRSPETDRRPREPADVFAELRANLVVDASERAVPPVVFEEVPTYPNLMGSLEAGDPAGPEHLRVRAGSLLRADGGVLVCDARELLLDQAAWRALRKALARGRIDLQRFDPTSHQPMGPVRPRAVEIALKVVLTGDDQTYASLSEQDEDFAATFKVKVELEDDAKNDLATRAGLAVALRRLAVRSGLVPPDAGALARMLEHAARLAGRKNRLSVRLGELLDVLREAEARARRDRKRAPEVVRSEHVEAALEARRRRHDLVERKTQELLDEDIVLVDLTGERVGVVNALPIYDTGDHVFARPARITAAVSLGRAGVIDIERESHLSGDTHHKGIQIIAGLLRSLYAQEKPLALTASLCFEQSYAPIDGDSASVAEVVAILSALAGAPVRQFWGVTGSLNQKGEVQAVGDVNQKIEGFHDACKARGLTGIQGVLIPASSAGDLMLREDVVGAVDRGEFHVKVVETVNDALAALMGIAPDEVHRRADAKLRSFAEAWRKFERGA